MGSATTHLTVAVKDHNPHIRDVFAMACHIGLGLPFHLRQETGLKAFGQVRVGMAEVVQGRLHGRCAVQLLQVGTRETFQGGEGGEHCCPAIGNVMVGVENPPASLSSLPW